MSKVVAIREKLKKEYESDYGVNPRTSRSSRAPPSRRCGTTRGSTARSAATRSSRAPYVNLGFAVELADGKGLIVPVI